MTHATNTATVINSVTAKLGVAQRAAMIRRYNDDARIFARAGTM